MQEEYTLDFQASRLGGSVPASFVQIAVYVQVLFYLVLFHPLLVCITSQSMSCTVFAPLLVACVCMLTVHAGLWMRTQHWHLVLPVFSWINWWYPRVREHVCKCESFFSPSISKGCVQIPLPGSYFIGGQAVDFFPLSNWICIW